MNNSKSNMRSLITFLIFLFIIVAGLTTFTIHRLRSKNSDKIVDSEIVEDSSLNSENKIDSEIENKENKKSSREEAIEDFSRDRYKDETQFDISVFNIKDLDKEENFQYNLESIKYAFMAFDNNLLVNERKVSELIKSSLSDSEILFESNDHETLAGIVTTFINKDREMLFSYIKYGMLYKIKDIELHRITEDELIEEINSRGAMLVVPEGEDVKKFIKQQSMSNIARIKTDLNFVQLDRYYEDIVCLILLKNISKEKYDSLIKEEAIDPSLQGQVEKYSNLLTRLMEGEKNE